MGRQGLYRAVAVAAASLGIPYIAIPAALGANAFLTEEPSEFIFKLVFLLGFLAILLSTLIIRLRYGATVSAIVDEWFYEVPPLRGLMLTTLGGVAAIPIIASHQVLLWLVAPIESKNLQFVVVLAGIAIVILSIAWVSRYAWTEVVEAAAREVPSIDLTQASITHNVPVYATCRVRPRWFLEADRYARRLAGVPKPFLILPVLVVSVAGLFLWANDLLAPIGKSVLLAAMAVAPLFDSPFISYLGAMGLGIIWTRKRPDRFAPFVLTQTIVLGLILVFSLSLLRRDVSLAVEWAVGLLVAGSIVVGIHIYYEQERGAEREARNRLQYRLRGFLPSPFVAPSDTPWSAVFASVSADTIAKWLSAGAEAVAELDFFAPRHFGRGLRVSRVFYDSCIVGTLTATTYSRHLRSIWKEAAVPASRMGLEVPIYDDTLVPLQPPTKRTGRGFPRLLDPQWNQVGRCDVCDGKGSVVGERIEDRGDHFVKIPETVACRRCEGSGYLEYRQELFTNWSYGTFENAFPMHLQPERIVPAARSTLFSSRFKQGIALEAHPASGLDSELCKSFTADAASVFNSDSQSEIVRAVGGDRLYEAVLEVSASYMVYVQYDKPRRGEGMLFVPTVLYSGVGPVPDWTRVPASWSMVGTVLLLPPLTVMAWYWTAQWVVERFQ